jgi:hypothetical protein
MFKSVVLLAGMIAPLICGGTTAIANEYPRNLDMLTNVDDNEISAMSGECQRERSGALKCRFHQTLVPREKSREEIEKEIADNTKATMKEVKSLLNDPLCNKDERAKFAAEINRIKATDPAKAEQVKVAEEMITPMFRVCDDPSERNVRAMVRTNVERENLTCKIVSLRPFELTFQLQPDGRWLSNDGPSGPCGVILITTLEKDPKYSVLWTYTQRRLITNKAGSIGLAECKAFEEHTQVFSWKPQDKFRQCKMIKFGVN